MKVPWQYGHIQPEAIYILVLSLHNIDGVQILCLAYDEDDTFPQRCGDHELCSTFNLSFDIVDNVNQNTSLW